MLFMSMPAVCTWVYLSNITNTSYIYCMTMLHKCAFISDILQKIYYFIENWSEYNLPK